METPTTLKALTRPVIVAHRGYRAAYPENTLSAFIGAGEIGAPMIELDVTLTRDRALVVIHDDTLNRTTDGRGPVRAFTLAEIKALDAGGWFHPRFAGERVPTLAEVFDVVDHDVCVNVEIKSAAHDPDDPEDGVERQVVSLVRSRGAGDRVLVSSFSRPVLERVRRLDGDVALGVLTDLRLDGEIFSFCRSVGAFSVHPEQRRLDRSQVAEAHRNDLRIFPYTVNEPKRMRAVLLMGVDGFFTDDPPAASSLLREG